MLATQHVDVRRTWESKLPATARTQLLAAIKKDYLAQQNPSQSQRPVDSKDRNAASREPETDTDVGKIANEDEPPSNGPRRKTIWQKLSDMTDTNLFWGGGVTMALAALAFRWANAPSIITAGLLLLAWLITSISVYRHRFFERWSPFIQIMSYATTSIVIAVLFVAAWAALRPSGLALSGNQPQSSAGPVSSATKTVSKEAKVVVLLSEVAGGKDQGYGVTDILFERLNAAAKDYPDVKIKRLRESIDTVEAAQARGKQQMADIVLWGSYLTNQAFTRVTIHFQTTGTDLNVPQQNTASSFVVRTAQIEKFAVTERFSDEMSCVVLLTIGLARLQDHDDDGAIALFSKGILLSRESNRFVEPQYIYALRAMCNLRKGQFGDALSDLNTAIHYRAEPEFFLERAMLYAMQEHFDFALRDIRTATIKGVKDEPAYVLRAMVYLLSEHYYQALADADTVITLNPQDPFPLILKSWVYSGQQKEDLAISQLEKSLTLETDPSNASWIHTRLGIMYESQRKNDQALAQYTAAILSKPENGDAFYFRSRLNSIDGRIEEAMHDANAAVQLTPDEPSSYVARAEAFHTLQQLDSAIADYSTALEKYQRAQEVHAVSTRLFDACAAHYFRGGLYELRGDVDKAIADFGESIKLDVNRSYAYASQCRSDAYASRCRAFSKKRLYDLAISDCTTAIRLNINDPTAYSERGIAFRSQQEFDKAQSDFDQAIKLKPQDSAAYFNKGVTYMAQQEKERAIAEFKKVVDLNNNESLLKTARQYLCTLGAGYC